MIIVTTAAGHRIGISSQIDQLVRQSRGGDYDSPYSVSLARNLGRRLALAAGTASLIEILHEIEPDLSTEHHAALRALWSEIIAELEDADDEDCAPSRSDLIRDFERSWGTGSWDRCEAAARAALRSHRHMTMDKVSVDKLQRHGIGTDLAAAYLVLVTEPQAPGRPRGGSTKRRREERAG
jgi:hypothetical protein